MVYCGTLQIQLNFKFKEVITMSCPFSRTVRLGSSSENGKGLQKPIHTTYGQSIDSVNLLTSGSDDLNLSSLSSAIIALIVPQVSCFPKIHNLKAGI